MKSLLSGLFLGLLGCVLSVRAEPVPTVVYGLELPPFIMSSPDGARGLLCDVLTQAFSRMQQPLTLQIAPWARGFEELKQRRALGLMPTVHSVERERWMLFPEQPLYYLDMAFFARRDQATKWSGDIADLQGLRIVKLRGAAFAPEFDEAYQLGKLQVVEANSFAGALSMVAAGRAELAAVPLLTGEYLLVQQQLQDQLQVVEPLVHRQPVFLALALGQTALRASLDQTLSAMQADGSIERISAAYRQ